ncbi:OmpA family protein [bacterium]|nr:OmpA family protein [bacterium]
MSRRPHRVRLATRAAILACALSALAGCSGTIRGKIPTLEAKIEQARETGAPWCAAAAFAAAEANLDFAITESRFGTNAEAAVFFDRAEMALAEATAKSTGCENDLDGDAIPDVRDGDPYRAEDYDGWEDEDGIPDYDNDGDGLLDEDDGCPDSPEDFDDHHDMDGCPDIDNDRDDVPDALDQCPGAREDIDGFQDQDGCPDPDNDADGIPDEIDKCPNVAETFNGILDDDGCPDVKPSSLKIVVGPDIAFSGRSTRLSRGDIDALQNFAVQLFANPELSVRVEAHVDPSNDPDQDVIVTQKRADAVRDALIGAGVEEERVIAIGFGGEKPIGTRNENNRVLLVIFQAR